ncbi:acylphosphatase [Opitutus terrae]|uniref:acylphosphatase n=1 Tax=Opitutus terrae (strain DSM 11246 / JCM 15787 / PB90-1) TaxID=452637 RepID=B1ZZ54_OPITP|nr:acylphosphatase [Opitutus terrae]ACB77126.1 acylphosphatase [Opitutus terrae PB90-1]
MTDVHHETIIFSGHVQGVGFRYSTLQIAKEFEVAGFVRNLPDGRVHVEVEGRADEIEAFVAMIHERMHGLVRKTERSSDRRPRQFTGFMIR